MRIGTALATGLVLAILAGCGAPEPPFADPEPEEVSALPGAGVTVTLHEMSDGAWRARYLFSEPQSLVFFSRSKGDYRSGTWTPLDDGATLERVGEFDAVVFDAPAQSAAFRVEPYGGDIPQDYTPFIPFTDGGLAIHTGQFELLAADNREAIVALGGEMSRYEGEQPMLGVRVLADATIIAGGQSTHGEGADVSLGGTSYIFVGETEVQDGPDYVGVIDAGLPAWLREELGGELGQVFAAYRRLWGEGLPEKASVLYAFRGFGHAGLSNSGGALGASQIMLESSGERLREPDPGIAVYMRWFFAHEIAHLFQGRTGAYAPDSGDGWIREGGANAMANIVLGETGTENPGRLMSDYDRTFAACTEYLEAGPLSQAGRDGRYDAFYQCGDLMSRATAAALPDHDLFAFWNVLLAAAETNENALSTDLYLTTMRQLGADPGTVAAIENIAREDLADPAAALTDMLTQAGLSLGALR